MLTRDLFAATNLLVYIKITSRRLSTGNNTVLKMQAIRQKSVRFGMPPSDRATVERSAGCGHGITASAFEG